MKRENEAEKFLDDYLRKRYDALKESVTTGKASIVSLYFGILILDLSRKG